MKRASIIYRNQPGAFFDWDYYMNNHLPLAVGTSMRHSTIVKCDVDKPRDPADVIVCICSVYFDSENSANDFCQFFLTGHPESKQIISDEPNYTQITPEFIISDYEASLTDPDPYNTVIRHRYIWPYEQLSAADKGRLYELSSHAMQLDAGIALLHGVETDVCLHGIDKDSEPACTYMLSHCLDSAGQTEDVDKLLDGYLYEINKLVKQKPFTLVGKVLNFDLANAEKFRNRTYEQ